MKMLSCTLLALLTIGQHAHCADLVKDWSFLEPGVPPTQASYGLLGVPMAFSGSISGYVVDSSTVPKNPFTEIERAYYQPQGTLPKGARIQFRPFGNSNPETGYFEFEFQLNKGTLELRVGSTSEEYIPGHAVTYKETDRQISVWFTANGEISGHKLPGLVTEDISIIEAEGNYTFKIAWRTENDSLILSPMLNDKPLINRAGDAVTFPIEKSALNNGVLTFGISSGSADSTWAEAFFGRVQVEPYPAD